MAITACRRPVVAQEGRCGVDRVDGRSGGALLSLERVGDRADGAGRTGRGGRLKIFLLPVDFLSLLVAFSLTSINATGGPFF